MKSREKFSPLLVEFEFFISSYSENEIVLFKMKMVWSYIVNVYVGLVLGLKGIILYIYSNWYDTTFRLL